MELTAQHIETIKKYFLADSKEEKLSIQDTIDSWQQSSFLTQLKQIFDNDTINHPGLVDALAGIGAGKWLDAFQEIQQDYYTNLAVFYNKGLSNSDTDALIKIQHSTFLSEVAFQKELTIALQLNERAGLKKQMDVLDSPGHMSSLEIGLAFKLAERQKLKQQFHQLDNDEYAISKTKAKVISFNWKKLAVAASVIAVISTTALILFNKDKKQQDSSAVASTNTKHIADSLTDMTTIQNRMNELLANTIVNKEAKQTKVLKENSLGFATKPETSMIEILDLNEPILKIDKEIAQDSLFTGFETTLNLLKQQRDSLMSLQNKYRFNNGTLSIYSISKKQVKIIKLGTAYYMEVGKDIYECNKSINFSSLKTVTDKATLNKIRDILFIN
ncbi:MAG: hypothetical protein ABI402_07865 [Ferruginibacter sp.]